MIQKLFDSDGTYRGFQEEGNIYNTNGDFVGYLDTEENVYTRNGRYIGKIINDCVVEDIITVKPPRGAKVMPSKNPTSSIPRSAILLNARYRDGFDLLEK